MKTKGVDARKVTMVVSDDFVGLEIPTFYHLKPGASKG
jgi:hypothetical protein